MERSPQEEEDGELPESDDDDYEDEDEDEYSFEDSYGENPSEEESSEGLIWRTLKNEGAKLLEALAEEEGTGLENWKSQKWNLENEDVIKLLRQRLEDMKKEKK